MFNVTLLYWQVGVDESFFNTLPIELQAILRFQSAVKLRFCVLEGNHRAQKVYRDFGFAGYELDAGSGKALFWDKKMIYIW